MGFTTGLDAKLQGNAMKSLGAICLTKKVTSLFQVYILSQCIIHYHSVLSFLSCHIMSPTCPSIYATIHMS